jgi:hypothetical protein
MKLIAHTMAAVFLVTALGGTSVASCTSAPDPLSDLQSALDGNLDTATQAALAKLYPALPVPELDYLDRLVLDGVSFDQLAGDPIFRKALELLIPGGATSSLDRALSIFESTARADAGALKTAKYNADLMKSVFDQLIKLLTQLRCKANTGTPGVTAAFANAVAQIVIQGGTATFPGPGLPVGSDFTCVEEFSSAGTGPKSCVYTPPCAKAIVDFNAKDIDGNKGVWTCTEAAPPPTVTDCADAGSTGTSTTGGGDNVCFVGDAVASDPAPWIEACTKLSPSKTKPLICLDANPNLGVGAPTLPNGSDPTSVCVRFHNADGVGTSLGMVSACDGEVAATCWCCP